MASVQPQMSLYHIGPDDRLIQAELSWPLSQIRKILNNAGLRLMSTQQWKFSGLPWYFHFWMEKNKRKKGPAKKCLKKWSTIFSHVCHVLQLLLPSTVSKLWYMAEISIYFMSRMPWEKNFWSENQPDSSGNIMVSPEIIFTIFTRFLFGCQAPFELSLLYLLNFALDVLDIEICSFWLSLWLECNVTDVYS